MQYANQNDIDFYAVNRGHALTTTVGTFNGIEIDLRALNKIEIHPEKLTATFQAGVYGQNVLDSMADAGYVTGKFKMSMHGPLSRPKLANWFC